MRGVPAARRECSLWSLLARIRALASAVRAFRIAPFADATVTPILHDVVNPAHTPGRASDGTPIPQTHPGSVGAPRASVPGPPVSM